MFTVGMVKEKNEIDKLHVLGVVYGVGLLFYNLICCNHYPSCWMLEKRTKMRDERVSKLAG